jgi:GNAT superfamily N-acetyltransferase
MVALVGEMRDPGSLSGGAPPSYWHCHRRHVVDQAASEGAADVGYGPWVADLERGIVIREAVPGEAKRLSELAMRSQAYWGYDDEFLEIVRPILTFSEEDLVRSAMYVLTIGSDEPAGVYRITGVPPEGELEDVWLEPQFIGHGMGRALFEHALGTAADLGFESLLIEGEPNAEGFYVAMGAIRLGSRRSPSGRTLPLLRVKTATP